MLVTCIFSFFQDVFNPLQNKTKFPFSVAIMMSSAIALSIWIRLKFYRLVQGKKKDKSTLNLQYTLTFPKQALNITCLHYKSLENTVGKGEIARNEQFLLFSQCFPPILRAVYHLYPFSSLLQKKDKKYF